MYVSYSDLKKPAPIAPGFPGRPPFGARYPLVTLPRPGGSSPRSLPAHLPAIIRAPGGPSRLVVPAFPRSPIAKNGGWIHPSKPMRPGFSGLGQVSTQQISSIAATGAQSTISILVALGAVTGPIGAAVAGVVAVGAALASIFKGCGSTCVQASDIANQVEQELQTNLSQYMSAPVHYASLQAAALNNFNTAWTSLTQACGQAALASAGQNCISERQQGACSYKTTPGGWQQGTSGAWTYVYPGANGSGSTCWNWFIGYHDPIANDPTVVPDPVTSAASSALTDIGLNPSTQIFGIPLSTLAIPAALLVALLLLMD